MDYNELLKDCLKLKPEAQRKLYEHFAPLMLGVCFRYTKSMSDSEEVLQEGFIKVFTRLHVRFKFLLILSGSKCFKDNFFEKKFEYSRLFFQAFWEV